MGSAAPVPPATLERYLSLFAARTDDYAYWSGWSWLRARQLLTTEVLARGLEGRPAISAYMIAPSGLTHVAALDFDTDVRDVEKTRATALWMVSEGVPACVEPTGSGRAHLRVTFTDSIPAPTVRRFLTLALWHARVDPDDKRIERFPASDHAPEPGHVGKALRLVLVPSPKGGPTHPLFDPVTMRPLGSTIDEIVAAYVVAPAERQPAPNL